MRNVMLGLAAVALTVGGSTACATKKYVNTQVSEVNSKVGVLQTQVEEVQDKTRENAQKIGEVDTKVGRVDEKAGAAQRSADDAKAAAATVDRKVDAVEASTRRLRYQVTLQLEPEKGGQFAFGKADLPDEAKNRIDELMAQVDANPQSYFFEVIGHTDNRGSSKVNERIGLERAEAVKRYLYEKHQIPLSKINVISYGEEKPLNDNTTRDGRASNRRVELRILS